jgi:RNA polymerase sigma-70 factor, ECF subfamily
MDTSSQSAASAIDPKLVARVAKGEHHALGQLYDQSSTVLFSLALRIVGGREDAEEVLQSVYLDVWRKVVRYDVGRGTPISWLITLTRSRAIERLRTHGSRPRHQMTASIEDPQADQRENRNLESFESHADQELRNLISGAWANLPQEEQHAIELSYYEGLPHTEIETRFNQPVDTVKTRITLGMSTLLESFQSYWGQDKSA